MARAKKSTAKVREESDLLLDLGEDGSRVLHLQLVGDVGLLVDGSPGLSGRSLTVGRGGNENIDTVDLSLLESLDLLLGTVLTDDMEERW